ncbi:MAG: nucleoside kinase, partial [Lachnospiraceae bacterium]|nr:nucleoside kinase [Lachnospiraceae bacterium]
MGEVKCKINIMGERREYPADTTYRQVAAEYQDKVGQDIVLVLINNRLQELHHQVQEGELSFVTTADKAGRKAYRRSVALLMEKAVYNVYGEQGIRVRVMHSIGQGNYCKLEGDITVTKEVVLK